MTDGQRAVLAHVVIDPDAWLAHAVDALGAERGQAALTAKVARWQPDFAAELARLEGAYQTRAQREA